MSVLEGAADSSSFIDYFQNWIGSRKSHAGRRHMLQRLEMAAMKKAINPLPVRSSCRPSDQSHKYGLAKTHTARKLPTTQLMSTEEVATVDNETSALANSNTFDDLLTDEEDDIMEQMFLDKALRKVYNKRRSREKEDMNITNKIKAVPPRVVKAIKEKPLQKSPTINGLSKAAQTKFTCNDNICGIIDTQAFNINCFYCYEIFAITNWKLFINHMMIYHNLNQRTQQIANRLISSKFRYPLDSKTKVSHVDVKLTGGKGKRLRTQNEAEDIRPVPPRKMTKSIVPDLTIKGDLKNTVNTSETTTSAPTKKFVKLIAPKRIENSPFPSTTNLCDTKNNIIKHPSKMKIILKKVNTEAPTKEAITPQNTELTSHKGTRQANADTNVLTSNKPKEEETAKRFVTSQENKYGAIKLTIESSNTSDETKTKTNASSTPSSPRSLICPIPYWNSDEEMTSIDKHEDVCSGSTKVCDDSEATTNSIANLATTTEPSLKPTDVHVADNRHFIKTTIEAMPPKVKSTATTRGRPFPSRYLDSEDEMPSNDENEDAFPNSTNGCGILFGLTNRKIVSEFLRELEKYPELYKLNPNNKAAINFTDSIGILRTHINDTFNIDMTDFEIRLSIQRIKYWYCRTLQRMEYSQRSESKTPFQHTFPQYFKIMDKFLTYDVSYTKDLVLGHCLQSEVVDEFLRYPKWMVCRPGTGPLRPHRNGHEGHDTSAPIMNVKAEDLEFGKDELLTDSEEERPSDSQHTHSPPEPIICDICFVDFNRRIDLRRHRIGHFPPKYACSTCKRMHYTRLMASKCSHVDTAANTVTNTSNNAKYMCEMCGASYKSASTLNYHKRDKHFNMRLKCPICNFTCVTNYRLVQHQMKRHVVQFGTCEEILKKTRIQTNSKIPYTGEARKEFEWLRDMRKLKKPGDHFYGCYKCKLIFSTRKDKMAHNKTEHPIKETTVVCLLCQHENALFANSCSVRRHYIDIHKVPWDEIDDLVNRTKPLNNLLTPNEINLLNNSDNHNLLLAQILSKKAKAEELGTSADDTDDDEHYDLLDMANMHAVKNGSTRTMYHPSHYDDDDESNDDDLHQSTLYNDFEVSQDYDETLEFTGQEEEYADEGSGYFENLVLDSQQFNENDGEVYVVEGNYGNDYFVVEVGQTPAVGAQQVVYGEHYMDDKMIEEEIIVEEDFNDDALEGCD